MSEFDGSSDIDGATPSGSAFGSDPSANAPTPAAASKPWLQNAFLQYMQTAAKGIGGTGQSQPMSATGHMLQAPQVNGAQNLATGAAAAKSLGGISGCCGG